MKYTTLLLFVFLAQTVFAAPIPGGTGKAKPTLGVYKSPQGFAMQVAGTDWIQAAPPKNTRYIATMFRSPVMKNNMRATLTVRVDQLTKPVELSQYAKRWTKEYPKFGFDVKGSKKFKMAQNEGYVVDLVNTAKKRQLRQVIFMQDKKAVLLTCRDHIDSFKESLAECNKMIKTFQWQQAANMPVKKSVSNKKNI